MSTVTTQDDRAEVESDVRSVDDYGVCEDGRGEGCENESQELHVSSREDAAAEAASLRRVC